MIHEAYDLATEFIKSGDVVERPEIPNGRIGIVLCKHHTSGSTGHIVLIGTEKFYHNNWMGPLMKVF